MTPPFRPGDDVGLLQDWLFDNPASEYRILRGDPRCSGRLIAGGPGHVTRAGIWRCTAGVFSCIEQGDELMTVLSGRCTLTDHATGARVALVPGDTQFIRGGGRMTWDVAEDVTKVFFGHLANGF